MYEVDSSDDGSVSRVVPVRAAYPYSYDRDLASLESGLACPPEDDVAQQQFKEESDINEIVRRFGLTGTVPEAFRMPEYCDYRDAPVDFHAAMNFVRDSQNVFLTLPAHVRARFDNDAGRLTQFLENPENRAEAISLGLIERPPEVARTGDAVPTGQGSSE